jgi:LPS export ABC transporter protein LptC
MISPFKCSLLKPCGIACLCFVLLSSCQNEISEIRSITDINNKPVQTSYHAEYIFSEKGKMNNKLIATQMDQYQGEQDYIEASGGFAMIFYDSLEQEEARLTAQNGKYIEKEKKLIAWDNVILRNSKGEKLETSELIFEQDSARIFTEKQVIISSANGTVIRGNGMISNDSFTKYKILQPTGDLYVEDKNENSDAKSK